MPADAVVESELKSLRDELSTAGKSSAGPPPADPPQEEAELRGLLAELADEAAQLIKEAEKDVVAHPIVSVGAALVAGIVIGILLGRR